MGKTYRHQANTKFDDERGSRRGKHHNHSNGKKSNGMRVINDVFDETDDYFDDEVSMQDTIVINKTSEQDPT